MKLYNTLTRQKEEFIPIDGNNVKMYVCGPTVYNLMHIGNARSQVNFDAIRRYLIYKSYNVTYVLNFTDVDDKIINKANAEGVSSNEIAERYIAEVFTDADNLNDLRADINPRATEVIDEIIDMVQTLTDKGFAYAVDGSVFFDTTKFDGYCKLSGKNIDDLNAGARIEIDNEKRNPTDFVLWKPAKPGEPFWASPWGNGRPGWHIECSVMAKKYLGETIDIHGGGDDLTFPHHENEIAQSEAANGKPFAKHWLHNGMINVDNVKMSKSAGNFFLLREIAEKFTYDEIRFFILSAHYRSPLNFSDTLLSAAKSSFDRIRNCADKLKRIIESGNGSSSMEVPADYREMFIAAMDDDFNTANAITAIFELVKFINTRENTTALDAEKLFNELVSLCDILGLRLENSSQNAAQIDEDLVNSLIEKRIEAKKNKDFAEADRLRGELSDIGVEIKDTREGTVWTQKN